MADSSESLLDSDSGRRETERLDIFWLGITIYSAGFTLSATTTVNAVFCQLVQILGIVLFIPTAARLVRWKFDSSYLKVIYVIYFGWVLFVFRGFSFDYEEVKKMLFDVDAGLFRFFVPLVLLFPKNIIYYKKIVRVIFILGIVFIIYDVLFIDNLMDLDQTNTATKFTFEHFTKMLSVPSGFILLTFLYHTNRRKVFAALVIVVSVTFAIIRARRALIFMNVTPLIIAYGLYLSTGKRKFIAIFFTALIGSALFLYGAKLFHEDRNGLFGLLTERMYEDTRTNVEVCLYNDMSTMDWFIGKGINGKYYCPDIDLEDTTGYRTMIETDYLNIILKGGVVNLGLILLMLIPAIFKGIFYSRNLLCKAAAIWILLWVIELYPTNVYSFSLNHIMVWMCVGICYSKTIRMLPESIVTDILSSDNIIVEKRVIFQ